MATRRYLVERIDQALRAWEDALFLQEMLTISSHKGQVDRSMHPLIWNWSQFRRFLIEADENVMDVNRFGINEDPLTGTPTQKMVGDHPVFNTFLLSECKLDAYAFLAWMTESRRVFGLNTELTHLLANTSLSQLRWADIKLPFNGFAIIPEEPIIADGASFDCLIVRRAGNEERGTIWITGFRSSLKDLPRLSKATKQKMHAAVRARDWQSLARMILERADALKGTNVDSFHLPIGNLGERIVETAEASTERAVKHQVLSTTKAKLHRQTLDEILRLVGSFCLYLQQLPVGSPHISSEKMVRGQGDDPKAIIWEADVTTVTNRYTISPEEQAWLEGSSAQQRYELSAHWRRGYWHRPLGQGDDPFALKTEWTRPTLVRKDRLAPETKPGGSWQIHQPVPAKNQ